MAIGSIDIGGVDPETPGFDPLAAIRGIVYPGTNIGIGALRLGLQPIPTGWANYGYLLGDGRVFPTKKLGKRPANGDGSAAPGSAAPLPGSPGTLSSWKSWVATSFAAHPWIWLIMILILIFWLFEKG